MNVERLPAESIASTDGRAHAEGLLEQRIELEMQSENLRQTQLALEDARDRCRELYEFAPVAYFTLDVQGVICALNHTAVQLFGQEREKLLGRHFGSHVATEESACWQHFFMDLLDKGDTRWCELQLQRIDGTNFFARLEGRQVESNGEAKTVRLALFDISERYREENLLRESEAKLRVIFEGTLDGIVLIDDAGKIVDFNPEFVRQSGMMPEQLRKIFIWEMRPPEKMEPAHAVFDEVMKTGMSGKANFKYKKPDGRVIHVEARGAIIVIGNRRYLQCIVHDTTERHLSELRIYESEQKFRAIYEGTPDGILLTDAQTGRLIDGNPAICRMLGYTPQELASLRVEDIHPKHDLPYVMDRFARQARGEMQVASGIPVKRRDGSVFYADITPTRVNVGGRLCLAGIFRDITEQRKAEEQLRNSALKYQALFEGSRDALVIAAPPTWQFSGANEAALKLFGAASLAEFTCLGPTDISPELQPDGQLSGQKAQEMIAIALQNGSHEFEWEHQRLDGQRFAADVLLARMGEGERVFVQATVRDVSEKKRIVRELKEHQRLLRGLAAQGAASREAELKHFAREVHDELGQLLTALRMDISLLRIQFGERDPALMGHIQDMLVLVDKAIQGARDVTANLHPHALDMGIVPAIRWLKDEFAARTGIGCNLQVVDHLSGLDDLRTLTLFRIVQESLTNIARYAHADRVEITIKKQGEYVCVEVKDNGSGFDPDAVRAGQSFGLLGMKERALAVFGKVEIASTAGLGTLIKVEIPLFQINPGRRAND